MNKRKLFIVMICLCCITGLKAEDILTLGNPDFETPWTGLQDYSNSLKKVEKIGTDVTGWTGDVGNGGLVIYQGPGYTSDHSAVLVNVNSSGACRFYNNSILSLTKGSRYKLTFYARGRAIISNVSLFQAGKRPTTSEATSGNAGGVYDPDKTIDSPIDLGDTWTKMEYYYTVPENSAYTDYKLYFVFYKCTNPTVDESNLNDVFMIDNISITKEGSSGILQQEINSSSKVWTSKGVLQIQAEEPTSYKVRNISGVCIASGQETSVSLNLPAGLYFVETKGSSQKVIVR